MVKGSKDAPSKRPIKAKSRLPAPRVSPKRTRVVWYRRRLVQAVAGLLVLGMIALGVQMFLAARDRSRDRDREKRAVRSFERSFLLFEPQVQEAVQEMVDMPERFLAGGVPQEELKSRSEVWLTTFRDLNAALSAREIPDSLEEARALLVYGTVLYIDAVKAFGLAADLPDQAGREGAVAQGRNLIDHAGKTLGLGRRALVIQKARLGLAEELEERFFLEQPIPLPAEEVPPRPGEEIPAPEEGPEAGEGEEPAESPAPSP